MIRILIADDHPVVRRGLRRIVSSCSDLVVAGEALDGIEVLEKVRTGQFDILVLDIAMPGVTGLEVLRQLGAERPDLPVLVFSIHAEEQYATRAMKLGAAGYLSKSSAPEELVGAIRKIARGGFYVSPDFLGMLAADVGDSDKRPHETLSPRERQVMLRIACGGTPSQIAGELSLNAKTVSTYRARILRKMRLRSNADLTRYAIREGIIR